VKLVKVDMDEDDFATTLKESHRVYTKYQMNVHHDQRSECEFEKVGLRFLTCAMQ
jgi:hypothetical protein